MEGPRTIHAARMVGERRLARVYGERVTPGRRRNRLRALSQERGRDVGQLQEILKIHLIIFVMIVFGSVYPLGKIATNNIPPILFSSLRVLIIFFGILPFFKFKLPQKKLIFPLIAFSLIMGIGVYVTLYFALDITSLVSPIIIGTQLTIPFGLILSFIFLREKWLKKRKIDLKPFGSIRPTFVTF